jgi:hypothetical protein
MPRAMRIILGPCRCQGCGATVWWATRCTYQDACDAGWRDASQKLHRCAK